MREFLSRSVWVALAFAAGPARAQGQEAAGPELGEKGGVMISAERLFGFAYTNEKQSMNGMDQPATSETGFSLLSNPLGSIGGTFSAPRLAIDGFVIPGLSVGAAVGVFHVSESSTPVGATGSDEFSITGFLLDPRIGYLARVSPVMAIWPRAGVSFIYLSEGNTVAGMDQGSTSTTFVAATVEVPFAFTIVPRVVFTIGPSFDFTFYGKETSHPPAGATGTSIDLKEYEIGVQAGLLVVL